MTRGRILYFLTFFLAVLALSWVFATWRDMWSEPSTLSITLFVIVGVWFATLFMVLGFFMYEKEKEKGKVTRKVGLYEWLEAKGWGAGV